eukprot:COSAG03_NODE_74_length_14441_cov_13.158974_2_plen_177_part_00
MIDHSSTEVKMTLQLAAGKRSRSAARKCDHQPAAWEKCWELGDHPQGGRGSQGGRAVRNRRRPNALDVSPALPPGGGRRPRTLGLAIGTTPPCNCTAVQTDGMDPNARGSGWVTAVRFPRRGDTGADFSPSLSFTLSAPVCTSDSIAVAHWARGGGPSYPRVRRRRRGRRERHGLR